jgi:hypothetical protein
MSQQPTGAPAIDLGRFDRILSLLHAARATKEALDQASPEERARSYPLRVRERDKAAAELARLTREARVEGAAAGLSIEQLDRALTWAAKAIDDLYSRNPGIGADLAYITACGLLESAADFVRGRAGLTNVAGVAVSPPPAPAPATDLAGSAAAGAGRPPNRASHDELEVKARRYLRKHRGRERQGRQGRVSARELAKAIGCSLGTVTGLGAWRALMEKRTQLDARAAPRASRPPADCEAAGGASELDRLIAESNAENRTDPSPTDNAPRRAPRHYKRA